MSFVIFMSFISFSCPIAEAQIFSIRFNRSVITGHLTMMFDILSQIKEVPIHPDFAKSCFFFLIGLEFYYSSAFIAQP